MLESLAALDVVAGQHGPADAGLMENASAASSAVGAAPEKAAEVEYTSVEYVPASGVVIDAEQFRSLYLPYD